MNVDHRGAYLKARAIRVPQSFLDLLSRNRFDWSRMVDERCSCLDRERMVGYHLPPTVPGSNPNSSPEHSNPLDARCDFLILPSHSTDKPRRSPLSILQFYSCHTEIAPAWSNFQVLRWACDYLQKSPVCHWDECRIHLFGLKSGRIDLRSREAGPRSCSRRHRHSCQRIRL